VKPAILTIILLLPLSIQSSAVAMSFGGSAVVKMDNGVSLYDSKLIAIKQAEQVAIDKAVDYLRVTHVEIGVLSTLGDSELKEIILLDSNFEFIRMQNEYKYTPCEHQISFCFDVSANVTIEVNPNYSKSKWVAETIHKFKLRNNPQNNNRKYIDLLTEPKHLSVSLAQKSEQQRTTNSENESARMDWYNLQIKSLTNNLIQEYDLSLNSNGVLEVKFYVDQEIYMSLKRHEKIILFNHFYNKSLIDDFILVSTILDESGTALVVHKSNFRRIIESGSKSINIPVINKKNTHSLTLNNKVIKIENL
jgi:hypothetical protein